MTVKTFQPAYFHQLSNRTRHIGNQERNSNTHNTSTSCEPFITQQNGIKSTSFKHTPHSQHISNLLLRKCCFYQTLLHCAQLFGTLSSNTKKSLKPLYHPLWIERPAPLRLADHSSQSWAGPLAAVGTSGQLCVWLSQTLSSEALRYKARCGPLAPIWML